MSGDRLDFDAAYREQTDAPNPIVHVLRTYGWRYRGVLGLGLLTAMANPLLGLVQPYLLGVVVDLVTGESFRLPIVPDALVPAGFRERLGLVFAILVATFVLNALVELADSLVWARLGHDVEHDLRVDTFESAQRLDMSFFANAETGDVMSVLNDDVQQIQGALSWFKDGFRLVAFGSGMGAIMLLMNWPLAVVVLPFGVLAAVFFTGFHRWLRPKYTRVRRAGGRFNARLENNVSGIETVKANATEAVERDRVESSSSAFRDTTIDVQRFWAISSGTYQLLTRATEIAVFLVGGWIVLNGPPAPFFVSLTVGEFVTFFFYARRFTDHMQEAGGTVNRYEQLAAAGRRVFGLMHYPLRLDTLPAADAPADLEGSVAFEDVTFSYPTAEETVLADVSFDVDPGEFVGVVGPTGAGKTTLCKLIVRFYDPQSGTVRLDGRDVREFDVGDLRRSIGYVTQEPFLFDETVRNNVAYATPDATDEEVVAAAKRARAHEFIVDLPNGYDTRVGERGVKLSGGQRQRVVVARELLRDPDVLLLDEATSHVDNRTEALIQESLSELIEDRTTIAVAHRLSTIRDADEIVVLENGRIVERGTHDQLLAADGVYAHLWNIHVGGPASETDALVE